MEKIIAIVFALAIASFAQDPYAPAATSDSQHDDFSAYTSGAPAPETPLVNINEVPVDEPLFFLYVHPFSLSVMSILGLPTIFVTFEGCFMENLSVVVRPEYLFSTFDIGVDEDEFEVSAYGLTLGLRHYFKPMHRGIYVEPEIQYAHVELDFTEGRHKDDGVTSDGFGLGAVFGWKMTSGHFSMFWDVGFIYTFATADGKYDDDVAEVSAIGGSYEINLGIGYAF